MQVIIDFFSTISSGVSSALAFLASIVSDIAYVATSVAQFVARLPSYFFFLPAPAVAVLAVIFGAVAVYMVVGRT